MGRTFTQLSHKRVIITGNNINQLLNEKKKISFEVEIEFLSRIFTNVWPQTIPATIRYIFHSISASP